MKAIATTATVFDKSPARMPMTSQRKTAQIAGIFYLLTFVSIPTLILYAPLYYPNYILGRGHDTGVIIGGILEIVVALAGISTAVVLYPVLRKQSQTISLGLVAARILESGTIFVGVAFLLSIIALRQDGSGVNSLAISHVLATLYSRIFLLGQSFMPAICDLLLGVMLYRSRLVPRGLSLIGIIGAAPLLAGYFAVLFGVIGQHSPLAGLCALPVALFEFSLGIYLVVKGFRYSVNK